MRTYTYPQFGTGTVRPLSLSLDPREGSELCFPLLTRLPDGEEGMVKAHL